MIYLSLGGEFLVGAAAIVAVSPTSKTSGTLQLYSIILPINELSLSDSNNSLLSKDGGGKILIGNFKCNSSNFFCSSAISSL